MEVEAKFRLSDADALRGRLRQLGAARVATARQVDHLFDSASGSLRAAGCALRVRFQTTPDGLVSCLLTYKGPREKGAQVKRREELETAAADGQALMDTLSRLGYRETLRVEKARETWTLPEVTVLLDHLPQRGWYVEIEARDGSSGAEKAVADTVARLGLAEADLERRTYAALTAESNPVPGT